MFLTKLLNQVRKALSKNNIYTFRLKKVDYECHTSDYQSDMQRVIYIDEVELNH